ncbi:hypothetical protein GOP47_0007184 [Adiantum capillus-veneris]|uniref:Prokaryotic-type class I peptide chain release factors domain-containing protein n=1 Tax=Adiantum capillus-veneris TaxID=13818 RepID=A0A9D4V0U7_ADICA|nr:hypothetical protein GOP47_0007184 [Adiantum capillus-veneris]
MPVWQVTVLLAMRCRLAVAMLRLKFADSCIRHSQVVIMATLNRLRVSSSSCSSYSSFSLVEPRFFSSRRLISLTSQLPHVNLNSTRAPSPTAVTNDEEWDLRDISSDSWFQSGSENFGTAALEKDEGVSPLPNPDEEWYKTQAEDEEWFRREEEFYEARISEQEDWSKRCGARPEAHADYLALSESSLFSQCRMDTFRASGPGGQHRNKTDSGVRLTHLPTGVVSQAVDDRSQHKNRAVAMSRLRLLIAAKVRRPVKLQGYEAPPELLRLLPAEPGRKSSGDKIGVNHPDFAKGIQALLDLLSASKGYIFYAAAMLRVNPNILSKILTMDKTVLQATNELLISKGQKPFK